MKSNFLKILIIIILIASFAGVFFVMSIMDLLNTKDINETSINSAGQLMVVESSINGIIPTGKDYYYIGINNDTKAIYTIHAGKNWLDKNFDASGMAINENVLVKGLAKRINDFEVEPELANRVSQYANETGYNVVLDLGKVLEINYVNDAILRLIAGVLILLIGIVMFIFRNKSNTVPGWAKKLFLVLFVATLLFALWTIL